MQLVHGPHRASIPIEPETRLRIDIFSDAILLKGESREKYESLLKQLWEALQPEGRLEELLLEKLATIVWRHRRLLTAEAAEIRTSTEFVEWDRRTSQKEEAEEKARAMPILPNLGESVGLIHNIRNPNILERCLELLFELQRRIKDDGFDREQDAETLDQIYGYTGHLREMLRDSYTQWVDTAEGSEDEHEGEGYATPEECKQRFCATSKGRSIGFKRDQQTSAAIESDRTKLETVRQNVPDSPGLDRLLRYEASLERAFDRTLNQLESLRRQRLGQPVAPRIDVNVTS